MSADEPRHLRRSLGKIGHVVDAFAGALEEAGRTIFRHVAARRHDARLRQDPVDEPRKLMFVSAGSVKGEDQRRGTLGCLMVMDIAVDCMKFSSATGTTPD